MSRAKRNKTRKSVMSRLGPLSLGQRLDLNNLMAQGIPEAEARAIAQGYSEVDKTERAGVNIGKLARRRAVVKLLGDISGKAQKTAVLGSDAHVPVPLGSDGKKKERVFAVAKAGWSEDDHPRADNGEFGSGSGGSSGASEEKKTTSGKTIHADKTAGDSAYSSFSAQDHIEAAGAHQDAHWDALARGDGGAAAAHAAIADTHRNAHFDATFGGGDKSKPTASAKPKPQPDDKSEDGSSDDAPQYEGKKLTKGETAALDAYTGGSTSGPSVYYTGMNHVLSGRGEAPQDAESSKANLAAAKKLQSAIGKQTLTKDATFYRGVDVPVSGTVGSIISSPGFSSVSTMKDVASEFADGRGTGYENEGGHKTIMTIKAPKGTHALDVSAHEKEYDNADDGEHIFGANQQFKVTGHRVEGNVTHLELEAIPGPVAPVSAFKGQKKSSAIQRAMSPVTKTGRVRKSTLPMSAEEMAYIKAALLQVPTESPVPGNLDPELEPLVQANRLVAGMDAEFNAGAQSAEDARRRASRAMLERAGFYDGMGVPNEVRALKGIMLDVGSGQNRMPGWLGIDLYPWDHGTIIHDVDTGLPFPDGSVRAINLTGLHDIIDGPGGTGDPIPLLRECQRVLCEGGRLYYAGPEPLYEEGQRWPLPGLIVRDGAGVDGMHAQELERVPLRVPAYHGADPTFAPAGPLPLDVQMALAAYNTAPAETAMANLINKSRPISATPAQKARVAKSIGTGKRVRVVKKDKYRQVVIGVVLEPHTVDTQGDMMTPEDIEASAHAWLASSRVIGSEHGEPIDATPVESYIAPIDFSLGGELVTKGSWLMGTKIHDAAEWQKVLDGEYEGYSVGGFGERE